ncbi:cyclin-J18 [Vigna radiata var. radiata]|uniref:B-like cyclin n=1 Tax=Vigna radiata var. radiata TaxID=3916 RepID=A0A3Q0EN37_VIGRR|nr:cyclin-J18 [Vigna radiata var. radiata]XP_022633296.1 cyclin-J18 [Vigna radiata var. radiata]XP_022633297.1 cyclin-J18 [Vigna radiata var. radiata]XP_022633298.1 cyclin-J18 [Vigna radiata var. radiata]
MEESKIEMDRVPLVEFFIQSAERLQVSPIVKYSAFSFLADRFVPSLPTFIQADGTSSSSWLLRPVTQSTLQLFALISLWISTKIHNSRPLSIACFKSLADTSIKEQHFTTRNFLEAEVLFMQVLNFEIGTANIAFFFLEDLWVQFRGVAKVGELISIEVCMDIMDLLYEKEDMSVHFRSPKSLAASILVTSYVITVPKQKWEFPVLAWVNFVTSCKEADITRLVTKILKHVLRPS